MRGQRGSKLFRRRGFTLVELLVVIAIIGVLVGLLLPAVQSAREAARRMSCMSRCKQIALAVHNYHATFKRMPHAWWLDEPPRTLNGRPWMVSLLPFIEQRALHDQLDPHRLIVDQISPDNVAAGGTIIGSFICPSTPTAAADRRYQFDATAVMGVPLTATDLAPADYCATTGVGNAYAKTAYGPHLNATRHGAMPVYGKTFGEFKDHRRYLTFSGILDGLSHTTLFGERTGGSTIYRNGQIDPVATMALIGTNGGGWADVLNGEHWLAGMVRGDSSFPPAPGGCAINCTSARGYGFHSFHGGGANFGFADGSIRFLTESIDPKVMAGSITRRNGEIIDAEF